MRGRIVAGAVLVILGLMGCGVKLPTGILPTQQPPLPAGEKAEFFPTVDRARSSIGQFVHESEARIDALFAATEDGQISGDETQGLADRKAKEETIHADLLAALDALVALLPGDAPMAKTLSRGRANLAIKYPAYNGAIEAGLSDQALDPPERTSIESSARSLHVELQTVEAALPLPLDSLKAGSTFVIQADSVDLFFEVIDDLKAMSKEMEELRKTVGEYQKAKGEMQSFLEREKVLKGELELRKAEIARLEAVLDTTKLRQASGDAELSKKISSASDQLGKEIRQGNESLQTALKAVATNLADSLTLQQQKSDTLFFQVGTSMSFFREQIDSLKGLVRYYDIAEKGLPKLNEELLGILKLPVLRNQITLRNGTIVIGQILAENLDVLVLQTAMGKLVIEKDFISKFHEQEFPGPQVQFRGDYTLEEHPEREVFTGSVENVGLKRADFVKVSYFLWGETTEPVGVGSALAEGNRQIFSTGVVSFASIEPGQTATYRVIVEKSPSKAVAYRTADIKWREYD